MVELITKKIGLLKEELAKQEFTADDDVEIEKAVKEYKQKLVAEKQEEYARNKELISAKIQVLEETRNEELEFEAEQKNLAQINGGSTDVNV